MNSDIQNIENFISQNKFDEAFDLFETVVVRYMSIGQKMDLKLIQSRYNEIIQKEIDGDLTDEDVSVGKTKIGKRVLNLLNLLKKGNEEATARFNILQDNLIRDYSYPFIKRTGFRSKVITHLDSGRSKVLLVEGDRESGLSYLEHFLYHFSAINGNIIKVISINMEAILNNPNTNSSSSILEILIEKIGEKSTNDVGENIKFIRFENALQKIDEKKMLPLFFFHDFHKAPVITEDVYNLIYELVKTQTKSLFIFSGLDYTTIKNWSEVALSCDFYVIKGSEITALHVKECFQTIFQKYNSVISSSLNVDSISFDDYYAGIEKIIYPNGQTDQSICSIGNKIKDHIVQLKRYQ